MWAKFVARFLLCFKRFLLCFLLLFCHRTSVFSSTKANISKLQFDLDSVLEGIAFGGGAAANSNYLNLLFYFSFKVPMTQKLFRRNFEGKIA